MIFGQSFEFKRSKKCSLQKTILHHLDISNLGCYQQVAASLLCSPLGNKITCIITTTFLALAILHTRCGVLVWKDSYPRRGGTLHTQGDTLNGEPTERTHGTQHTCSPFECNSVVLTHDTATRQTTCDKTHKSVTRRTAQ